MLPIGMFAHIGQVTHRMLRHWDAAGLLRPAHVDTFSGYRSYDPSQLQRLHQIVALRDLGFGLEEISLILDQGASVEKIADLLQIRQTQVEAEHQLATQRLAAGRFTVAEQPEIAGRIGPLFDSIAQSLQGESLATPIAQYNGTEDGVEVIAGYATSAQSLTDVEIIELPAVPEAICGVHLGSMDTIHESWQAVHEEVLSRGLVPTGPCREVYVRAVSDDQADWVTELQQPVGAP